jgi:hypothetical protein
MSLPKAVISDCSSRFLWSWIASIQSEPIVSRRFWSIPTLWAYFRADSCEGWQFRRFKLSVCVRNLPALHKLVSIIDFLTSVWTCITVLLQTWLNPLNFLRSILRINREDFKLFRGKLAYKWQFAFFLISSRNWTEYTNSEGLWSMVKNCMETQSWSRFSYSGCNLLL